MAVTLMQASGQVEMNTFITKSGGGFQTGKLLPVLGGQTCFFGQFPLRADKGVLGGGIQLAGGDFQRHLVYCDPMLAYKYDLSLLVKGNHGSSANMAYDFPLRRFPVG